MSKRALIFLTLLGLLAIAVSAFQWNWLRGPVASYLSVKLDREVKIDGDLHVELWKQFSWKPFSLKDLVPKLKPPHGSAGKVDGRARFATTGNSVAEMLTTSNGEIALTHTGGAKDADCGTLTQEAQANVLARPEAANFARAETAKVAQAETTKRASAR